MNRREWICAAAAAPLAAQTGRKFAVLTFDDAVKSHRTFVAPLLREMGFRATFFVTHQWMNDTARFMNWREIAEIHEMGFEIGNHSWTHANFAEPRHAARLHGELALVENELKKVNVPVPVSFAYSGNGFGPEAVAALESWGYRFARRGAQPEVPYGKIAVGAPYEPGKHHPLLIPTTGDAYPDWTLDHFKRVAAQAGEGRIAVFQFHGVPDAAHPWVHTPPERFREYMAYLKAEGFETLALRDLARFAGSAPDDPVRRVRHPQPKDGVLRLPAEEEANRKEPRYWAANNRRHGFGALDEAPLEGRVLPYPGGRHPRIGFLEGAIDPLRGTKASVFAPWPGGGFVVVDVPEAIFSNLGLLFLAHTHVPTIWNQQNVVIENRDWERREDGSLVSEWNLPNRVSFGAVVRPAEMGAQMELWLRNGTAEKLTGLRTQICVLLKGASGFEAQTTANKKFGAARAEAAAGGRRIVTEWERCGRTWGNAPCPCIHSDPVLADCAPEETVRVSGWLRFEGA
jgi:peptidoglycan/xylan/chitin deacetylase (PgdA/CDA1 family)